VLEPTDQTLYLPGADLGAGYLQSKTPPSALWGVESHSKAPLLTGAGTSPEPPLRRTILPTVTVVL